MTNIDPAKYPMAARQAATAEQREAIHDFMRYLAGKDFDLGRWDDDGQLQPYLVPLRFLIDDYLGINSEALEAERRQMLQATSGS